jgi:hypothetical protein
LGHKLVEAVAVAERQPPEIKAPTSAEILWLLEVVAAGAVQPRL